MSQTLSSGRRAKPTRRACGLRSVLGVTATVLGCALVACGGAKKAIPPTGASTSTELTTPTAASGAESTTTTAPIQSSAATVTTSGSAKPAAKTAITTKLPAKVGTGGHQAGLSGGITNVTAPPTTAKPADIEFGGSVTYLQASAGSGDGNILRALTTGFTDAPALSMIFDLLVYTDADTGQVVPQTAQSLTSTDGLVWTLKLRPNIKFTDGSPYDAAAVKFNIARLQDPVNAATRAAQAKLVKTMDVIDDQTLKMTLTSVNAVFPYSLALIPFVGSPTAIQAEGNDKFVTSPVGAGPFMLQSQILGSTKTLVRNPNYWNAPLPYLDKVILKVVAEETQRANTFKAGEANLVNTTIAGTYQQFLSTGAASYSSVVNGGIALYLNMRTKPFSDSRARQAVTMAFDRADLVKVIDDGVIAPMNSIFRDGSPFYDSGVQYLGYDPLRAQQLFDSLAADTGGPLSFDIYALNSSGNYVPAATYIQAKLNTYKNVKVGSVLLDGSAAAAARAAAGNFSALVYGAVFDDPDQGFTSLFDCTNPTNPTGFCDQEYQNLAADQRSTLDPKQRIADIKQMQKLVYAAAPAVFFERRTGWVFGVPNIQNVKLVNDGLALFDRMWIKTHG
jgi:peptide/nickel transport system substrate-binding protein